MLNSTYKGRIVIENRNSSSKSPCAIEPIPDSVGLPVPTPPKHYKIELKNKDSVEEVLKKPSCLPHPMNLNLKKNMIHHTESSKSEISFKTSIYQRRRQKF